MGASMGDISIVARSLASIFSKETLAVLCAIDYKQAIEIAVQARADALKMMRESGDYEAMPTLVFFIDKHLGNEPVVKGFLSLPVNMDGSVLNDLNKVMPHVRVHVKGRERVYAFIPRDCEAAIKVLSLAPRIVELLSENGVLGSLLFVMYSNCCLNPKKACTQLPFRMDCAHYIAAPALEV